LRKESGWTDEQKQARIVEIATLHKAAGAQRKINLQIAHDAWLTTLSETDRLLARSTPVGQSQGDI
jgi:hypothetical protein